MEAEYPEDGSNQCILCYQSPVDLFLRSAFHCTDSCGLSRSSRFPAGWMRILPQITGVLKMKDIDGNSLLMHAVLSKNAVMFNAVITFVAYYLPSQEVIILNSNKTKSVASKRNSQWPSVWTDERWVCPWSTKPIPWFMCGCPMEKDGSQIEAYVWFTYIRTT